MTVLVDVATNTTATKMRLLCLLLLLSCLTSTSFCPSLGGRIASNNGRNVCFTSTRLSAAPETSSEVEETTVVEETVEEEPSDDSKKEPWWKRAVKGTVNVVSSVSKKIKSFRKSSGIEEFEEGALAALRNTTFSKRLQQKYHIPDTSAARVEIFINDLIKDGQEEDYDIDKVLAALQNLNNFLGKNGTVWELAREFTGSWRIATTNTTLTDFNITLYPSLIIPNLSVALIDPDNVELVRIFGEFQVNPRAQKLEFRFPEMSVLGIRAQLPEPKSVKLGGNTVFRHKTVAADEVNKTKPFTDAIATNETSESMNGVLDLFDSWYNKAVSDDMLDGWYDEVVSDDM